MPEGELIELPLSHYMSRYRKAYSDMAQVSNLLGQLKGQKADTVNKIKFFETQAQILMQELSGAELALRSAIINQTPPAEPTVSRIPEPVVKALTLVESLQPKPEPEGPGEPGDDKGGETA